MPHRIVRKGTLLISSGSVQHLHIVCNDPVHYPRLDRSAFLCVNISSVPTGVAFDETCILQPGDHSFIAHNSFVFYGRADIFGRDTVLAKLEAGEITAHQPCAEVLFIRVL